MNAMYNNSWPEEQQHFQRHQDLLREADKRRLIRLARGESLAPRRSALRVYAYAAWDYAWCRLHSLQQRLAARLRPATPIASPDCR